MIAAAAAGLLATLDPSPGSAFELIGHEIIEAAAYKRLLSQDVVQGTGVSGRTLLGSLIAGGVLYQPPCFDLAKPQGDCSGDKRLDLPLTYWPILALAYRRPSSSTRTSAASWSSGRCST